MNDKIKFPQWCVGRPFRLNIELNVRQSPPDDSGEYIPVQLSRFDLENRKGEKIAPDSISVVQYDELGNPLVFDPDASGEAAYRIPFRFDPDCDGFALPDNPVTGALVFLARSYPERQRYSIYFDLSTDASTCCEQYHGLIGDGDIFAQKQGRLSVPGCSRPVYYGDTFFGKRGLLVAAAMEMGLYFFEEVGIDGDGFPQFKMCGRLKDSEGRIIFGIPAVHDVNGDGKIDLVMGRDDGTIVWHENTGSNEKSVFAPAAPFKDKNGQPLDLKPYLLGKNLIVDLADGTINPRYPRMPIINVHGGRIHLHTTPMFIEQRQKGRYDLLVGTKGGYYLHFKHTGRGYGGGEFIRDAQGNVVSGDFFFPSLMPQEGKSFPDLIAGGYHGNLAYIETDETELNEIVFRSRHALAIQREMEYSFPMVTNVRGKCHLFVGNFYGEVKLYQMTGMDSHQTPVFDKGRYLETSNAWITRYMPTCHYADFDGDGRKDLLSGDIKGGLFFYKNIGTDKNPLFDRGYWLQDENGPIKIEGGPDPFSPDDGYAKPAPMDMDGQGKPDLLVGTGLGRILRYDHQGLNNEGKPYFKNRGVLKDSEGHEIRCHHMSAVACGDLDHDGVPDLIVSGQKNVHAFPDDDPDNDSQVRWYRGVKDGDVLRFHPYIPMEAEGDREFGYRPIPPLVDEWQSEPAIYIGGRIFRQIDCNRPQCLELVRWFPPRLAGGWEAIIPAYFTLSSLGKNDPLIVQGSCIGSLFAFRKSFVVNRDYLQAECVAARFESAEGRIMELNIRYNSGAAHPSAQTVITRAYRVHPIDVDTDESDLRESEAPCEARSEASDRAKDAILSFIATSATEDPFRRGGQDTGFLAKKGDWNSAAVDENFRDSRGQVPETSLCPSVQIAYTRRFLLINGFMREPVMPRLINRVRHSNGPIEGEDHVFILLDTGRQADRYVGWWINADGFYKEAQFERKTGEEIGPWRAGGPEQVGIETVKLETGYHVRLAIPFAKLGGKPKKNEKWLMNIRRYRAVYANEIRAVEQRLSESLSWSGKSNGWVRLMFEKGM